MLHKLHVPLHPACIKGCSAVVEEVCTVGLSEYFRLAAALEQNL
jgi:hypothetical protein